MVMAWCSITRASGSGSVLRRESARTGRGGHDAAAWTRRDRAIPGVAGAPHDVRPVRRGLGYGRAVLRPGWLLHLSRRLGVVVRLDPRRTRDPGRDREPRPA